MSQFPKDPRKIRAQIRRYERSMREEEAMHGYVSNDSGTRYLLGMLYLLMDDVEGALDAFAWFQRTFPDDVGEPFHYLAWALALYRAGALDEAAFRLRQAMCANLYLIPHLLGIDQPVLDIRHDSNWAEKPYVEGTPPEHWALWDDEARAWARRVYESAAFQRMRRRYIEISRQLDTEPRGPTRSRLVDELYQLKLDRDVEVP
jgi:tetratricopeptide (TPR) repeat protein